MKRNLTPEELAPAIRRGERRALAKGISLVESSRAQDRADAHRLLDMLRGEDGKARRIGISGVPGVGKSTFIDVFGMSVIEKGGKVAVLSIDPSSERTGGSILGDKTRMPVLARHENAFIRPTPSGGTLGGVARTTRESVLLCEAAGYDTIIIETVGVGQSEVAAARMVDCFLLLCLANAGDELQGIKRGIMEEIDVVIINKVDEPRDPAARRARQQLLTALHMLQANSDEWTVPVLLCSALRRQGFDAVHEQLDSFFAQARRGLIDARRRVQAVQWFNDLLKTEILEVLLEDAGLQSRWQTREKAVREGVMSPHAAVEELVDELRQKLNGNLT